jgi:hypothetical protein
MCLAWPAATWAIGDDEHLSISDTASGERIRAIDRSLLLELLKLARFNIRFHQEANRHQNWRTIAYATGREAGTAVSFSASLGDLRQRVRGLEDPSLISRRALKEIVVDTLVGSAISGSASGLELSQNAWVMFTARQHGYSSRASITFVKSIVGRTNTLFEERERLLTTAQTQRQRRVLELENVLLHRIRQQLLFEFQAWSCQSRGQAWRENSFYGMDAFQNFTRMSATLVTLKGFSRPNLGGGAAITSLIANSVATLDPIVCGLIGRSIYNYQRRKLAKEFSVERPFTVPDYSLFERLKQLQKDSPSEKQASVLEEAINLSEKSERFDLALDRETREIERLRRVAQQQTIAGPVIGLTSMPAAILGTIAFYDYRKDRDTTNKMLFAGRLSALPGQAFALVQTPNTLISGIVKNRRLKQLGELPSQLLEQRLNNIDVLENEIRLESK